MEAIILAGGFGTRLQTVVADVPKPMAPIAETPFLSYLLNYLYKYEVRRVILSTGYLSDKIYNYYGDSFKGNMELIYSVEQEPLGTGGGVLQALKHTTSDNCFIINGDTFFDVDLQKMMHQHNETIADMTIALKPMYDFDRYGTIELEQNRVVAFQEKQPTDKGYINGGIYILNKDLLETFNLGPKFSLEADFLQKHYKVVDIRGFISSKYFIDIGIPEDYYRAQSELIKYGE
ncbi:nucleotidyltransferase family protein [Paenibacillus piscarius]|uniref:nucleotidyltransferase family protein n=1 Tax=Paenibacillus piscarius TaxID=1089681 RepID=UPI001EE9A0E1|nr:nucleotidyltransferase family protein [Paenibacillus piscarius]